MSFIQIKIIPVLQLTGKLMPYSATSIGSGIGAGIVRKRR